MGFFNGVQIVLISHDFPPLRGVKQECGGKNKLFSCWVRQYLENGRRYGP